MATLLLLCQSFLIVLYFWARISMLRHAYRIGWAWGFSVLLLGIWAYVPMFFFHEELDPRPLGAYLLVVGPVFLVSCAVMFLGLY